METVTLVLCRSGRERELWGNFFRIFAIRISADRTGWNAVWIGSDFDYFKGIQSNPTLSGSILLQPGPSISSRCPGMPASAGAVLSFSRLDLMLDERKENFRNNENASFIIFF
jgi:hypothetical protein